MPISYAHRAEGDGMTISVSNLTRQATNLSIDVKLLGEAKALKINVSRAAEAGIAQAVSAEKARLWKLENRAALDAWNDYVDQHGLPLAKYRQF